uniref:Uncharacterized protein n=1 Tax=Ditylenchus dipsaci TaxID=166011 RepID=A0A915DTY6_9BILA
MLNRKQTQSIPGRVFTPLPFAPRVEAAALDPKHAAAVDNRVLLTQLVDQRERSLESRSRRALAFLGFRYPDLFAEPALQVLIRCCSGVIALAPAGTLPARSSRTLLNQRRNAVRVACKSARNDSRRLVVPVRLVSRTLADTSARPVRHAGPAGTVLRQASLGLAMRSAPHRRKFAKAACVEACHADARACAVGGDAPADLRAETPALYALLLQVERLRAMCIPRWPSTLGYTPDHSATKVMSGVSAAAARVCIAFAASVLSLNVPHKVD